MITGFVTDDLLSLSWARIDTSYAGCKPRLEFCADGDGCIVIRKTKEGHKLFDQGRYIRNIEGGLVNALASAEAYMRINGYELLFSDRE